MERRKRYAGVALHCQLIMMKAYFRVRSKSCAFGMNRLAERLRDFVITEEQLFPRPMGVPFGDNRRIRHKGAGGDNQRNR